MVINPNREDDLLLLNASECTGKAVNRCVYNYSQPAPISRNYSHKSVAGKHQIC